MSARWVVVVLHSRPSRDYYEKLFTSHRSDVRMILSRENENKINVSGNSSLQQKSLQVKSCENISAPKKHLVSTAVIKLHLTHD
jgi:hypothetical protein